MLLRKAVESSRGQATEVRSGALAEKLSSYAGILASQGCLDTALHYLGDSSEVWTYFNRQIVLGNGL